MGKLRRALGVLAVLPLAAVAACGSGSAGGSGGSSSGSVTLGSLAVGVNSIVQIAYSTDAFKDNGLDVKLTDYDSGTEGADVTDLESGRTQFAYAPIADVLQYDSQALKAGKELPLKLIAASAVGAAPLVLKKGLPFNGVNDLRGKTIAVAHDTSSYIPILDSYLEAHGTSRDKLKIKLVSISGTNMVPSLAGGRIDGFIQGSPIPETAEKNGVGSIQISGTDWGPGATVPLDGLFAKTTYIADHKGVVQKMVKALEQANSSLKSASKDKLVPVIASFTKDTNENVALAYENLMHNIPLSQPFQKGMEAYFKIMVPALVDRGVVDSKLTPTDVADFSFAK